MPIYIGTYVCIYAPLGAFMRVLVGHHVPDRGRARESAHRGKPGQFVGVNALSRSFI